MIFIKGYVTLWCLSRFTFHYDVIEGYITLRCWAMVCYSGRLISVMSHCDVYHGLCYISDIHQGLCHIVIFVKGYVTLSYLSRVMSHCDVYQCWRFSVMLSRVISHYDVKPWFVTVFGWYMSTQPRMWHINSVIVGV